MKISIPKIDNETAFVKVSDDPEEYQIYAEYMSSIILQLPNSSRLQLLTGTSSAQASFYFLNNEGAVNASLYNNFLNQRILGKGKQYGVKQVGLSSDSFINSYLSVYTKLRYQLSPGDKAAQQRINANVSATVRELTPLWNTWVTQFKPNNVSKLNETNTDIALIQITDTLNTVWINSAYIETLQTNPSFPYTHLEDFKDIYNQIPATVSNFMIALMINIYRLSGASGEITSCIANATHTLASIIYNLQKPTKQNKGLSLTGTNQLIPGIVFEPKHPNDIVDQLNNNPVVSYTNNNEIVKLSSDLLKIKIIDSDEITIPPLRFLSNTLEDGTITSVFKEIFSGTSYFVEAIVKNPVVKPQMRSTPMPFDIISNTGWMLPDPAKEAIKNGYPAPTGVTGYVFNSKPNFNFNEGGDFGYINSFVFSQFLELYISFTDGNVEKVKNYFENNKASKFNFLGNLIGKPSISLPYSYKFSNETNETIMVVIKPEPPGYLPPNSNDVANSSCLLVAVEIVYPFA